MGDMEFDPVRNVWVGNDEDLDIFQRASPALITNMSQYKSQPQGEDFYINNAHN
jgi:hypothetical protein